MESAKPYLLRWGVAIAAVANLIVAFAPSYSALVMGYALASLGYGFCRPGFTAGASLAVNQALSEAQGGRARSRRSMASTWSSRRCS